MPSEGGYWHSRSSEAEHPSLLIPGERETGVAPEIGRGW
jgi:hypothetical protein